ncbi:MAG: protein translocase subunit SecD [Phycisphaerales bacterium]|nr:MAG: protein translocase subunit SecD [Phycisphaerales bacterium]
MQNMGWKLAFIIILLAGCIWAVIPPKERIHLGKDLRGGVSLIYRVNMDPDEPNKTAVLTQTISVLLERINPTGVLDIAMQPMGVDRIEVVSPLPSEEVKQLRDAYDDALEELLRDAEIPAGEVDSAVRLGTVVEQFGGQEGTERYEKIKALQDAFDARQEAQAVYDEARANGASGSALNPFTTALARANRDYREIKRNVERLSLDRARVVRMLRMPTERAPLKDEEGNEKIDEETGEPILGPGQRAVALEQLKSQFSHLSTQLDDLVTKYSDFQAKRRGFDDPEDLKRLLRGAGVLEFRIAVMAGKAEGINVQELRDQLDEVGAENVDSTVARWLEINDLKQWYDDDDQLAALERDPENFFASQRGLVGDYKDGKYYLLIYTSPQKSLTHEGTTDWKIDRAWVDSDRMGRACVAFRLDPVGGQLMGRLTGPHVQQPMAIILDGQVFGAPTLQTQILNRGQITGSFSRPELLYLIRVLEAGALSARLTDEPIAVNTLGPSLGADNLRHGLGAFKIAIIAVAIFMMMYYFFAGLVADFALAANGVLIFGLMALLQGTFTLPGLAGIVLTIGMAVDANVLIYERIREEIFADDDIDLRTAVRLGYSKALSTIIDANITNLIVCAVLYKTATTEVKGFATTLSIGICATLFTALFVTRQIYYLYTDYFKLRKLPMLATTFPAIHRALEPNIKWISLRKAFWAVSLLAVIGSVILVSTRGIDMLDTELRGGLSATMLTKALDENQDGEPDLDQDSRVIRLPLRHTDVVERVHALGDNVDPATATNEEERIRLTILRELQHADVLTAGRTEQDASNNIRASSFQIKVPSPRGLDDDRRLTEVIVAAIVDEFGQQLDVTQPLDFVGAGSENFAEHTFALTDEELGLNINRPEFTERVADLIGGVVVLIEEVEPAVQIRDLDKRITSMRQQPDYNDCSGRTVRIYGLDPADPANPDRGFRSFAVCVFEKDLSSLVVQPDTWDEKLAKREWELISESLQRRTSLEQVSSYSSAVAQTLQANATVAVILSLLGILVYIWIRFGSLRYSVAAIVALVHDVTIALGLLAISGFIAGNAFGTMLGIEEFRIDLGVVAALLTIIGYSLNDTIVILDRIRENRGKLPVATASIVNRSINQTVSRTLLTSVTTLLAVAIMYGEGGSGIRPFTYCLLIGLIVGTYSSVAIAAPLVFKGDGYKPTEAQADLAEEGVAELEPA